MRFNIKATIYKIEKIKDGQGGYTENKAMYKDIYCHISTLKVEKQIQLFGVANYESLNLVTMSNIDIDSFCVLIGDTYYKPVHKPKAIKNKTYLTLDVLDHAN
jgi:hypothetical protein